MQNTGGDDEFGVTWELELEKNGEVPRLGGDDGVLRIGCVDTLLFRSPAGSLLASGGARLVVRSELGEEKTIDGVCRGAVGDWEGDWHPARPGPFEFFFLLDNEAANGEPRFRIVVDPTLRIKGAALPARAVVQLTVLSRCAGPIERWPETLAQHGTLGYNMVHFTPIQPPGESGSCYSLDDQNNIDATLMEAPADTFEGRLAAVKESVGKLEKEHGLLSAMDIVLNHTAGTAPWLLDDPESAYNITNSPHLLAAAELDEKLVWFSNELRDGRHGGGHINDTGDVDRVMHGIQEQVLRPLKLAEYYELDHGASLKAFSEAASNGFKFEREDYAALKDSVLPSLGARRKGAAVGGEAARRHCRDEGHLRDCLRRIQEDLWGEWHGLEQDMIGALRGVITYERLECRKGPVGDGDKALVPCYFRRLKISQGARQRLGKDTEVVAHNGWVMGWPATEDFAAPSWRNVYLRRHLCAWGDCVKLRFGEGPEDAPMLWDHMTRYAVSMANIFHAIRLDNAHSTPLHVSRHVLAQVRKANPHCWVFAELFTGNFNTDLLYQGTLGINALIREAMQCHSVPDFAGQLSGPLWGAHGVGEISRAPALNRRPAPDSPPRGGGASMMRSASCALIAVSALPLRPRPCPALLFDCTHDNQTPAEKRHPRDALPNAALVAASCASIGSVRGYDELLPFNPSVVFERRRYADVNGAQPFELTLPSAQEAAPTPKPSKPVEKAKEAEAIGERSFELVWNSGASTSVVARGGWDGWKAEVPLTKQGDGRWLGSVQVHSSALPVQYKFIVDGNWTQDHAQPTVDDGHGNVNNVLGGRAQPPRPASAAGAAQGAGVSADQVAPCPSPGMQGIFAVKQVLNSLHERLARECFTEAEVRQLADDVLAVQRRSPDTGRRTYFITRSAYGHDLCEDVPWNIGTLDLPGAIAAVHVAATLYVAHDQHYRCGNDRLTGLQGNLKTYGSLGEVAYVWQDGTNTMLKLKHFPPGSVLAFSLDPNHAAQCQGQLDELMGGSALEEALRDLSLSELSYLLFSCENEESDRSGGKRGAYDIPGHGPFVYCGLMGVCAALDIERASRSELSSSPIAQNIREGDWLLDYLISRLDDMPRLGGVRNWLDRARSVISRLPRDLAPFHFDIAVSELCSQTATELTSKAGIAGTSPLLRDLALSAAQFWGATPSAPLHWDKAKEEGWQRWPSLCAGLPHFASGFMRNWGRDTFISLRGCLLATGRFDEARSTLLVYAGVVRHGLCPNLLDAANKPRYNARDATWFFLQGIQDYVNMAPEGLAFLKTPINLKWPVKEWEPAIADLEPSTMADLVHLIFVCHARGINFREWGAGQAIDEHMNDRGFDISVRLDEETGVIFGGNEWNCGTWMDKNGSSDKAGNRGVPATPRDGAAVEIVGLVKSTLRWVSGLGKEDFPHERVKTSKGAELTYKEWDGRLQANFERLFWVGEDDKAPTSLRAFYRTDKAPAPLRDYYRDTVGATRNWQDFQLRPNFPIAMAVAPELFTPSYARKALKTAGERLVGPLGMCTLDPSDPEYRGDYHNDNDSEDKAIAHGWNYHQGPEWVWPLGFYLKACHHFFDEIETNGDAVKGFKRPALLGLLLEHRKMLAANPWRSLPELTNSKGSVCHHSCPAQAWSIATILDALKCIEDGAAATAEGEAVAAAAAAKALQMKSKAPAAASEPVAAAAAAGGEAAKSNNRKRGNK